VTYTIRTFERDGRWLACANREDTGDPFGIECSSASEADATGRLTRWIEWQCAHAQALDALQTAERAYHRAIAVSGFANPGEESTTTELRRESLYAVDAARVRLDAVRACRMELS
jgi:hypothetical protein